MSTTTLLFGIDGKPILTVPVNLTGTDLATLFYRLPKWEQAAFFNALGEATDLLDKVDELSNTAALESSGRYAIQVLQNCI